MSQEKQTAEEVREDIIERTYHNINDEPDKSAIHIRIALNNYAVPFEKKLQDQAKEIADLVRSRDDVFHELEGYKEHNKQLQEEIERLKGILKEIFDDDLSDF